MESKQGAIRYVELAPRPVLPLIEETAQAIEQLQDIKAQHKEHFVGLYLNARHELIHKEIVSIGTANASIVHPRDVFAPALMHNATAVIVAHNHPSGDATPSAEDRDVTHRLKEGGRLSGYQCLSTSSSPSTATPHSKRRAKTISAAIAAAEPRLLVTPTGTPSPLPRGPGQACPTIPHLRPEIRASQHSNVCMRTCRQAMSVFIGLLEVGLLIA